MITIRNYDENMDALPVSVLISETGRKYNLDSVSSEDQERLLGRLHCTWSVEPSQHEVIPHGLRTDMIFVAEDHGQIVGMLRCKPDRLKGLFVHADHHRLSIGLRLVERCEQECTDRGSKVIRLSATLHAVPFYEAVGYKKSTGIRSCWSFGGRGLQYQPMKKKL